MASLQEIKCGTPLTGDDFEWAISSDYETVSVMATSCYSIGPMRSFRFTVEVTDYLRSEFGLIYIL